MSSGRRPYLAFRGRSEALDAEAVQKMSRRSLNRKYKRRFDSLATATKDRSPR